MREIIREMRALPGRQHVQCSFLTELGRAHPQALGSDAMMGNFAYALHTARVDVAGLMIWVLALLGENAHWVAALRADVASNPDATEVGGLADRIIRETLRMRQSEFLIRRARKNLDCSGFTIPEGWHIRMCVAESHRSSEAFDEPDRFDPDRFLRNPKRSRYAPFGFAPHLCPGEHLTRWIGRNLVVEIARDNEISCTDVQPWEFPLFNVSYRRSFLLDLGESLGSVLLTGQDMRRRISAAKGKAIFEPGARIGHVNITRALDESHVLPGIGRNARVPDRGVAPSGPALRRVRGEAAGLRTIIDSPWRVGISPTTLFPQ